MTGDADCSVIAVTSSCTLRLSRSGDVKLDLTLVRSGNIATPYSASTSTTVLRDGVALTPAIPAGGSAYTGIPVPSATVPVTTVLTVGPYTVTVTVVPPGA